MAQGKSWRGPILQWMAANPRLPGETDEDWKVRSIADLKPFDVRPSDEIIRGHRATFVVHDEYPAIDAAANSYERRLWLSMLGRGILAAYLLGLLLSLGELNPRDWQPFAGICAFSFLIGWVVMMNMERE